MHLVVLYGYQGADHDPEQLAFYVSPPKSLAWAKRDFDWTLG